MQHADQRTHSEPLLVAIDQRARTMKISRNRLIMQALERAEAIKEAGTAMKYVLETGTPTPRLLRTLWLRVVSLVSANLKHMTRVPGVEVEDWSLEPEAG
jgi:2-methylisocitrate lyase-like PEP mutase family enzyme